MPIVQDLQCHGLLLRYSAEPRVNHALRTIPADLVFPLALRQDAAIWQSLLALLHQSPGQVDALAHWLAVTPLRDGGMGLRMAMRIREVAFWASRADALPLIQARFPQVGDGVVGLRFPQVGDRVVGLLQALDAQERGPVTSPSFAPPGVLEREQASRPSVPLGLSRDGDSTHCPAWPC